MGVGAGWIIMTARRLTGCHLTVAFSRFAAAILMHMEAMLAGREIAQIGGEPLSLAFCRQSHGADWIANTLRRDLPHFDLHLLGLN
jgi:hypothetical protein